MVFIPILLTNTTFLGGDFTYFTDCSFILLGILCFYIRCSRFDILAISRFSFLALSLWCMCNIMHVFAFYK